MTTFWIVTFAMALAVSALLVLALLRGRRDVSDGASFDMQVYRDQMAEVDRDLARGVLGAEDAERLRAEVGRRLLSADTKAQGPQAKGDQPPLPGYLAAALMVLVLIGGTFALYMTMGAPGYGDLALADRVDRAALARAERPSQEEVEAQITARQEATGTSNAPALGAPEEYADLVVRLRAAVAERPGDLQGHVLLARSEAALGNYDAAWRAQDRIVSLKGDAVTATDFADLADMMVLAAGGYVSPEAEQALEAALARDPQNGVSRYYMGLMLAQTGRPDAAFRIWEPLLRSSDPDAPWVSPIRAQIQEMAMRAGVNYQLPAEGAAPRGPTADDIEAAGDMSVEDRQEMIQGMVAGLSDRLATQGGTPEEWAQLIAAYGVLGDEAQAIAIWNNALEVFADQPEALETVRFGARRAGIVP